jgi:uncharacterized beta-barrel protein YwiB (DUF1934 family)
MSTKKKQVCVDIKSTQSTDIDSDTTEFFTYGELKPIDGGKGGYSLVYNESDMMGYKDSKVILSIDKNNMVTMKRKGRASTNLIIESGRKHHCHYGTEYGDFIVGITADEIRSELSEQGGELYLKYTVDVNSSLMCRNEMKIQVRERL